MIKMRNSLFALAALCSVHALAAVTMSKVAEYDFAVDGCGGIAYAGGNQFYVLRDHGANGYAELYPLTTRLPARLPRRRLGPPYSREC